MKKLTILLLLLYGFSLHVHSASHGGIKLNIEMTFGNQNIHSRIGLLAFGTSQQSNIAAEFGVGVWAQAHIKQFNANTTGWSLGYDTFGLIGLGDNSNLLGSALSEAVHTPIFRERSDKHFVGLGYGVINEHISGTLNKFGLKRGKLILRAASQTSSLHLSFANDLRISIIPGGATDYGQTANVELQYTKIKRNTVNFYGLGFNVFTPQPDFSIAPDNPINSDEGVRRVWYTTSPWNDLFHANAFLFFGHQNQRETLVGKIGVDSPKLGAYSQNKIHDGFGLLPRYPWPVNKKNTVFFEFNANRSVQ